MLPLRTFLFKIIKMKKLKLVSLAIAMASAAPSFAGGLLTNTNQHVAFNRMMSREASIGIDGVYYNPAGVVLNTVDTKRSLTAHHSVEC